MGQAAETPRDTGSVAEQLGLSPDQAPLAHKPKQTGADILAKIEANRIKRLRIADEMKREAGVVAHKDNGEFNGGVAWIDHGVIESPEGRKIVQLYTLAHECGHIFLHSAGTTGRNLPAHVMEMEAESYAHQCLAHHGMHLPKRLTDHGRRYVGSWVAKDRAAGIKIDPRVLDYVSGERSPFEPLRVTPETWRLGVCVRPGTIGLATAASREFDACDLSEVLGIEPVSDTPTWEQADEAMTPAVAGLQRRYVSSRAIQHRQRSAASWGGLGRSVLALVCGLPVMAGLFYVLLAANERNDAATAWVCTIILWTALLGAKSVTLINAGVGKRRRQRW
jgi:hypothetical protein